VCVFVSVCVYRSVCVYMYVYVYVCVHVCMGEIMHMNVCLYLPNYLPA